VDQVKRLRRKIASGKKTIEPLIYKKYTGWLYNGKKISEHQVDAFLVYYLFACKMAKI
jgi:hypothetical protein